MDVLSRGRNHRDDGEKGEDGLGEDHLEVGGREGKTTVL